ncbi:MAG: putative thymidylate synthase [Prokaryotic dsDNA virus sp.]|nr:MAG: putative thymidylate synthase [Prokaryotic dsDNA virus sp.]
MSKPSAEVICHSQAPNVEELITLEIELHRFVLPEFNTHRVFSRNFQSSRAVPVAKMIEQVKNNPAIPVHWGKNQAGMVAEEQLTDKQVEAVKQGWVSAAKEAAKYAEALQGLNAHKQITNRLLEPFMWTKGVVTATREGFDSFFKLRLHKDAQPEIQALAKAMFEAIQRSTPVQLKYGEYHLPYVDWNRDADGQYFLQDEITTLEEAIKVSTSCTGQVSYRKLDDSLEKALKIYDMLNLPENGIFKEDPPHFSPTEHVAKVVEDYEHDEHMTGNFVSGVFWQYRKALEVGSEDKFMETK